MTDTNSPLVFLSAEPGSNSARVATLTKILDYVQTLPLHRKWEYKLKSEPLVLSLAGKYHEVDPYLMEAVETRSWSCVKQLVNRRLGRV
jgi:hypothetical protein